MHELWELKQKQNLPLSEKIDISLDLIREWYEYWKGQVYVSFSGGKDSTVLLDLVRKISIDIPAVFVDTGLEYPEVKDFVKTKENVIYLRPKMNFRQVIEKYGYPFPSKEQAAFIQEYKTTQSEKLRNIRLSGNKWNRGKISKKWLYLIDAPFMVSDKCCDIMKKAPIKKYEKETGRHPIIGTMACESDQRQSNWQMYGCNAFTKKRPTSQPLSFWTEQDILMYIKQNDLNYASVYGDIIQNNNDEYITTKRERTGCMFCMFGCHFEKEPNRFQKMKITHPKLYDYCLRDWDAGGLGIKNVLDYINVKY